MRLSPSKISKFQGCPAKYNFHYNLNVEAIDQDDTALNMGTRVHTCLESWFARQWKDDSSFSQLVVDSPVLEATVLGYHHRWKNVKYTLLANETERIVDIGDDQLFGIWDKLIIDAQGRTCIVEHKTTRQGIDPGSRYWDRLVLNTQIDFYFLLAEKLGIKIDYILYDVIRIPQLRPLRATPKNKRQFYKTGDKKGKPRPGTRLKPETPKEFKQRLLDYVVDNVYSMYIRKKIFRTQQDIDRTQTDFHDLAYTMGVCEDIGAYPRNPNYCYAFNRECEFLPVCTGTTDINNEQLYQLRKT